LAFIQYNIPKGYLTEHVNIVTDETVRGNHKVMAQQPAGRFYPLLSHIGGNLQLGVNLLASLIQLATSDVGTTTSEFYQCLWHNFALR
jgi:hypothetical protein